MIDLKDDSNLTKIGLTLKIKNKHQGQVINNGFLEILDIENVEIDPKIKPVTCLQLELGKIIIIMNVCDLEFESQPSRSRI